MNRILLPLAVVLCLAGCTSIEVRPLPYDAQIKDIKLIENPKVIVDDFVPVMEKNFSRHGIGLKHFTESARVGENEYVIRYSAKRSWMVLPYLADANVRVYKGSMIVAEGKYHLIGRFFCLSPYKWQGVETKMQPVFDELLKNYRNRQ